MAQGYLRVTIVEAAKLTDKDKRDFNDPYVEVYIDEKNKQKTCVLRDVERPIWNETFEFVLWPSNEYLYIDVYDDNQGKKPDLIGSAKISLDDVIKIGHFDDWVKLPGFLGFGSHGDVHMRMSFERRSVD
ncbi:unnamed protein product [Rotaria sp. Silwood1]|nr:unnamed protein product [Rotaria sp. Silwood1]CAF1270525.1 unnamed protein product [Rotaria sp. Silwood1]CAF1273052.1 unnamed protein product [Rotaria sp. Silwood1]CAF3475268.1 unnamed protein product [Rotaria sp. Silwood1]CAF3525920.1 unnamed protein product [Rotaria sp. Silwood1]